MASNYGAQILSQTNPQAVAAHSSYAPLAPSGPVRPLQNATVAQNASVINDVPSLESALKAGAITRDSFLQRYAKLTNEPTKVGLAQKLTDIGVGGAHGLATGAREIAQGTARAAIATPAATIAGKTLVPGKLAQVIVGKSPVQTIQQQGVGAASSHPGGFHIPGTPITLSPTQTGLGESLLSGINSITTAAGGAKGVVGKVGAERATSAGLKTTLQNVKAQGLLQKVNEARTPEVMSRPINGDIPVSPTLAKSPIEISTPVIPKSGETPTGQGSGTISQSATTTTPNRLKSTGSAQDVTLKPSENMGESSSRSTSQTQSKAPNASSPLKPGEEGFVDPGAAIKDAKALIEKHQQSVEYSGDINRFHAASEGAKGNLLNDAAKLTKNRTQLTVADRTTLQDYRDAKMQGKTPIPLPEHLKAVDQQATDFAKAKIKADAERARLEGNLVKAKTIEAQNPETYTHRAAQGKGSAFDYVLQNDRKNPLSVGMGKTTPADKARNLFSVTDENGNTRTVSIKSSTGKRASGQKFNKPNQVVAYSNAGKESELLGSLKSKTNIEGKQFTGKDGKTYTINQAGASQISKDVGQKYYVDPYLTNQAAYLDSRVALENARMFDAIKSSPLSEKFMSAPEETAPKGWKPATGLDQFRGYRFEPRIANALHDIFLRSKGEPNALDKIGQTLRQAIVYFPVKHDFNILSSYAIDRGLTGLVRPIPAIKSIYQAAQDVAHNTPFYQELARKGFELTTNDRQAFEKVFSKELNKLVENKSEIQKISKALGNVNPVRLYKAIQRVSVWDVQDIANIARVRERMAPGVFKKGMSMEDAITQTEKFSFQYKVPERVLGTRTGSNVLQSKFVFFGRYRYDQYKIIGNIMKDSLKVGNPKQAAQAWDRMAALLVGSLVAWPLVDKGIQNVTGNKNAYITAPGPLQLPELAKKVADGKESGRQAASNQVYLSSGLTIPVDIVQNRDPFTGKNIIDDNATKIEQGKQLVTWIKGQLPPVQTAARTSNSTANKLVSTLLAVSGTSMPKNSPLANKLNSLKFDTLPTVQQQAKAAGSTGDNAGAMKVINQYDESVLQAARQDLKDKGVAVPDSGTLIRQLKKSGFWYQPKQSTINNWSKTKVTKPGSFTP